jgi:hypothetical protein
MGEKGGIYESIYSTVPHHQPSVEAVHMRQNYLEISKPRLSQGRTYSFPLGLEISRKGIGRKKHGVIMI